MFSTVWSPSVVHLMLWCMNEAMLYISASGIDIDITYWIVFIRKNDLGIWIFFEMFQYTYPYLSIVRTTVRRIPCTCSPVWRGLYYRPHITTWSWLARGSWGTRHTWGTFLYGGNINRLKKYFFLCFVCLFVFVLRKNTQIYCTLEALLLSTL